MSRIFEQVEVGLDQTLNERLHWLAPDHSSYRILRQSVDARRSQAPHWVYSVEVFAQNEQPPSVDHTPEQIHFPNSAPRPIVVGSGPAGLFAALRLVERGIPCLLLERGSEGAKRIQAINRFWRYGELDPNNNVCFGEGGAGLYSDGKLITRIKSPYIPYVMDRLVRFGAPEEIRYLANPHVGSDRIRRVIPRLREFLKQNGCEILFDTKVTRVLASAGQITGVEVEDGRQFHSPFVVMATGHSAEDILHSMAAAGVHMEGKSFAIGLRIEHPQKLINRIQYRNHAEHPALGAANYRLADHDHHSGVGVYSFCMCPGGYVLSSGTEADGIVCNGMSNYHRNSPFANAAIVVSVDHAKLFGSQDVFSGLRFRRELETKAFASAKAAGGRREIPAQKLTDFIARQSTGVLPSSSPSGVVATRLDQILPDSFRIRLQQSLEKFGEQMKGFMHPEAQLHGVESRTSCPVRITRDAVTLQSISHRGLFPAGEGAGYAGGITSAACDGIRIAERIALELANLANSVRSQEESIKMM